jgi:hypothetical protein
MVTGTTGAQTADIETRSLRSQSPFFPAGDFKVWAGGGDAWRDEMEKPWYSHPPAGGPSTPLGG